MEMDEKVKERVKADLLSETVGGGFLFLFFLSFKNKKGRFGR